MTIPAPCGRPAPCDLPCNLTLGPERHVVLELGDLARLAVMLVPGSRGEFRQQAMDLFAQLVCILSRQAQFLTATTMMVFLRDGADEAECRQVIHQYFKDVPPVTTFVVQPPCGGAALGVELWALGGPGVEVKRFGPHLLAVESNGIRWVHCGGVCSRAESGDPCADATGLLREMQRQLGLAGVGFEQVVRTWIYVNQITDGPPGYQRYQELNRARAEFFDGLHLRGPNCATWAPETVYPASTGIGTQGNNITMSCMALDSSRRDVFIMPLENPHQTSAFGYSARYSPHAPRFSRAMAVVQGHFISTLVSGTASIVNSRSCHLGDARRQTLQTLENIEQLIAPANFARHGLAGGGATLRDIAKLRVYVKRAEDYETCRDVCEERLPGVPAIYLQADVCRPDLLVEIEAVAFSPYSINGSEPRS